MPLPLPCHARKKPPSPVHVEFLDGSSFPLMASLLRPWPAPWAWPTFFSPVSRLAPNPFLCGSPSLRRVAPHGVASPRAEHLRRSSGEPILPLSLPRGDLSLPPMCGPYAGRGAAVGQRGGSPARPSFCPCAWSPVARPPLVSASRRAALAMSCVPLSTRRCHPHPCLHTHTCRLETRKKKPSWAHQHVVNNNCSPHDLLITCM
jgi:hypothetical protein